MLYFFSKLSRQKKALLPILFFLLVWKVILFIIFPDPGADGPIYTSHTFSILRGDLFQNDFLKDYIPVFNFPYLFGFLNAPFYFFTTGNFLQKYSINTWNILWVILFAAGSARIFKKTANADQKTVLFLLAYIMSPNSFSNRSETFILPFFILLLFCCNKAFKEKQRAFTFVYAPGLLMIIGLMHPVAGIVASTLVFLYALETGLGFKNIALFFLVTLLYVAIFYLPVIFINIQNWKETFIQQGFVMRTHSFFDFSPFIKYVSYNPSILLLLVFIFINNPNPIKELIQLLLFFFVICFFHQSYYFQYLFAYVLWRLYALRTVEVSEKLLPVYFLSLCYSFAIVFVLPTVQLFENPDYSRTFNKILDYETKFADTHSNEKIWVPGDASMSVIDKPNIRLHWTFAPIYSKDMPRVDTSSIFFVTHKSQLDYIDRYPFANDTKTVITEILPPVKGLITVGAGIGRSESLGLWEVTVASK